MDPITTALGFTISKAVFKAWFKDNEFASSASEGIADIVKGTISDRRARGAADRHLSKIADGAADALESYISFEWPNIHPYDQESVVNIVQNAIDSLNINSKLMAAIDFNTERLSALVTDRMETGSLSPQLKKLAENLCSESSQMISDLTSSFPEFHRDTYAEVLRRESEIIDNLDKVFVEIQNIRETVAKDSSDAASSIFAQSYRRSVARELDKIELFGLDTGIKQSSRQHSLSTAYISLSVSGGGDKSSDLEENDSESDDENIIDKRSAFSIRAEEAVNLNNLVIIKGEAGSGKTTLLQSFAVRSATASYTDDMQHWNDLVPFFVRLRALTGRGLPAPQELPSLVAPMISGTMPTNWAHEQLASGKGLLLVDGLDEVPQERRDETRKWIDSILSEFPLTRIIVTSRPTAVPENWLVQRGFQQLELLTMSPDDVSTFIDHWHDAVAREEQTGVKRGSVHSLVPALQARIRSDRALRELAATPLLCAMLCAMNRDRNQVLPTNRIALYEAAVQTILHGRDEERRIRSDVGVRLDFETKIGLIQEVSFWMMQNGTSMADQWRVEDFISSIMRSFTKLPTSITSRDILNSLVLRSGILRSPIDGKVDFIHNAFKEYLCAKAVITGDRFGYLKTMLHNEAWREVAVLAAAMADDVRRSEFISDVLSMGDRNATIRATYHLLAVRCLETCTQLAPALQDGIKDRLKELSAPTSLTEARSLSAAGELALPLLKKDNHYARTAAACVRALRLIGTPEAMEYMKPYAADGRSTVAKEVIAAWPFFDTVTFARDILSMSRGVYGNIRIDYPSYLVGIRYLTNARGLTVSMRSHLLPDWAKDDLLSLGNLDRLYLYVSGRLDLSQFKPLKNLTTLHISNDHLSNINSLEGMTSLQRLSLSCKTDETFDLTSIPLGARNITLNIPDLPMTGMLREGNSLFSLSLTNDISLDNSSFILSAPNLRELTLRNINHPSELINIGKSPLLSKLTIFRLNDLQNLFGLECAKSMTELSIINAESLNDISALETIQSLDTLIIRNAPNLSDISAISKLKKLRNITLDVGEDVDLSCLRSLDSLYHLTVSTRHSEQLMRDFNDLPVRRISSYVPHLTR